MTEDSSVANRLSELADEFVDRLRRGERPDWRDYAQSHPELAADIGALFPTLSLMEQTRPSLEELENVSARDLLRGPDGATISQLGDYRIVREIGRGGMGIVFEAEQESLGRRVALKVLSPATTLDPRNLQRFDREARAVARLHHTHIVQVFGVGQDQGFHYFVMQYVDGVGVDELLEGGDSRRAAPSERDVPAPPISDCADDATTHAANVLRGSLPGAPLDAAIDSSRGAADAPSTLRSHAADYFRQVATIGRQVAEALDYAHAHGVLHRDVKPSNVLLDRSGSAWLVDFGLAKADETDDLTRPDDVLGTLRYMAPERLRGISDARSDIYSLGLTLYELVTFRYPFETGDRAVLTDQIVHIEPISPRKLNSRLPRDLEIIIVKAMQKEPASRYSNARQIAEDLRLFLSNRPIRARRIGALLKASRWCRRNPALAGLTLALFLTLLVGFLGISWQWRDAVAASKREHAALQDAAALGNRLQQNLADLKATNKLVDLARKAKKSRRWDDVYQAYTQATVKSPTNGAIWLERGETLASWGLFSLAAADYQRAFDCEEPEATSAWHQLALLQLSTGNVLGYRATCRRLRERFGDSSQPGVGSEVVRTSLLCPDDNTDVAALVRLAASLRGLDPLAEHYRYLLGTATYRAGDGEQAARIFHVLPNSDRDDRRGLVLPVLALAQWRAGKQVEAETTLTAAERCLRHWWTVRSRTGGYWLAHWDFLNEWPIAWWDWLEFEWYYREAYSQIRGCVPQPDPRNNLVLARTYAALRWNDLAGETFAEACRRMSEDDRVEFEARRHRGYHAAVRGDWPVAVKAFVEIQQQEPDDVLLARFRAMAHLAADDLVEYRRDCGAMLTRYGATDVPTIAWVVLYVCLSDPNAIDNPERLLPIAEIARRGWHDEQRCFGAALYRSGKYAEAAAYLENLGRQYHREPWECCFLAMAYQQLGNARQARLNLELAAHLIDQMDANLATDLTGNIPSWGVWDHRIVALRLLREARALLDGR